MSDVIFWVLILAAFVLAFIGLIKPVIPAIPVLWVGFLIYQFGINGATLSWGFLDCNDCTHDIYFRI